jgi:hypothetical protein
MSDVTQAMKCQNCGEILQEPFDLPAADRSPCPKCGSTVRHFEVTASETVTIHDHVGIKARHGSSGTPFLESKFGDSLQHKTGEWMSREMTVDRENDRYKEIITNPETGKVIHHCEEPLSSHRGHGSAKKKV